LENSWEEQIDYGLKRLPADISAADLRTAAELISSVTKTVPKAASHQQALFDRAAKLDTGATEASKRLELEGQRVPNTPPNYKR
jgi:hypothetical protein